jgi:hypothetical protein
VTPNWPKAAHLQVLSESCWARWNLAQHVRLTHNFGWG